MNLRSDGIRRFCSRRGRRVTGNGRQWQVHGCLRKNVSRDNESDDGGDDDKFSQLDSSR